MNFNFYYIVFVDFLKKAQTRTEKQSETAKNNRNHKKAQV